MEIEWKFVEEVHDTSKIEDNKDDYYFEQYRTYDETQSLTINTCRCTHEIHVGE